VPGDAVGAALLGGFGAMLTPAAAASASGWGLAIVGAVLMLALAQLRRFRQEAVQSDSLTPGPSPTGRGEKA